jgi:dolichol-phosphate mannosyltransferase
MTAPERGKVSIVLATFNERENILDTIDGVFQHVPEPVEVIVVDDDSPDQTWKLVADRADPRVKLIRRTAARGLASAFLRGIIESTGEIVGWMDADMCMPPRMLPGMIEDLREFDLVIGSRYVEGAQDDRARLRVLSSRMINGFASFWLGHGIKDYDSGFVVLRRSVFDRVLPIPTGYGEYFIEFIYGCCRKGLKLKEVPYVFKDRAKGVSKSAPSLYRFFKLGLQYVIRIIEARFRRID